VAAVFGLPDNDELISRVTTLESSVGTLEDDVTAVEVDVATLQADVEEINLGKLDLIGLLPDGTGQTAAEGIAELAKLNAFTRGQDWHDKRANIDMECLRVPFGGTDYWEITRISGLKIKTSGLSVGQIITENGTNTGSFGGLTYIAAIPSPTTVVIQSTTACTSGNIVFDGTGPTSTPTVCVPVHRGFIGTVSTNTAVLVGARGAQFVATVTKLPQIRYLPGQLVELTGDIELIEEII